MPDLDDFSQDVNRLTHKVLDVHEEKETPEDAGCLERFERSAVFQSFITFVILLNTIGLALEADNPQEEVWNLFDDVFLYIYTIELLLRLAVYKQEFFHNSDWKWNWFDFLIVLFGLSYEGVMHSADGGKMQKLVMVMRMLRLLRILRAFKIFVKFPALRRLMTALISSVSSVGWIAVFFFVLVFVYSIFATVVVKPGLQETFGENSEDVQKWFGTIYNSMVTLWIYLTMDDWSESARTINDQYPFMVFVWISYIVLGAFMILSLLTGLMADKMAAARAEMEEEANDENVEELDAQLEKFHMRFKGDQVDCEGFCEMIAEPEMAQVLDRCGVKVTSDDGRRWLFRSIDRNGDGTLTWSEFYEALKDIGNHRDKSAALRELLWMEGKVMRLDKRLENEHRREGAAVHHDPAHLWERQLDDVHARASFLHSRLNSLDHELQQFFVWAREQCDG